MGKKKSFIVAGVKDPIGIILFHSGTVGDAFDVFVRKDKYKNFVHYEKDLYKVGCHIGKRAEEILGENYVWIGSEDYGHISNIWVDEMVKELMSAGFIRVSLQDVETCEVTDAK